MNITEYSDSTVFLERFAFLTLEILAVKDQGTKWHICKIFFLFKIGSLLNYDVCLAIYCVYYYQVIWERGVFVFANFIFHLI